MKKKHLALLLIIICTFLTAAGQIAWKIGVGRFVFDISLVYNYALWAGFVLYGLGALLLIYSLRYGNLSFVHPFLSLGYIWAGILAFLYLNEDFPVQKIIGTAVIVAGTFFIFRGDRE